MARAAPGPATRQSGLVSLAPPEPERRPGTVVWGSGPARWILFATVLGSGIAFLDATVVNVALPAIGEDLDAGVAGLQWTVNGYAVTLAALILLSGALGDRFGRRRVFVIGVIWFALASLLCALAPNLVTLVAARALQGVGGALLTPGSLAIIQISFAPGDRARAVGAWSGLTGIAAALGPFLGGWLVEAWSWRLIFLINLPLALAVAVVAARHVPESRDAADRDRPLDVAGSGLAVVALSGITYALIGAGDGSVSTAVVSVAGAAGVIALAAFVAVERMSSHPMMPLSMFASRQFTSANVVTFLVYGALGGTFFLLVVFLQQVLGYSPIAAGAATVPVTALMLVLSSRVGQVAYRIGPRLPMALGPIVVGAGLFLLSRLDEGSGYATDVLPAVVVFGLGLSLTVAPLTATVLDSADPDRAGVASGINNAISRGAGLVAVAVLPLAAGLTGDAYLEPDTFTDGFRTAMLLSAVLAALGGVLAWFTISNRLGEPGPPPADRVRHECPVGGAPLHPDDGRPEREPARPPATAGRLG
jgi:EmrB/QacA subfamily drug resistance transporter